MALDMHQLLSHLNRLRYRSANTVLNQVKEVLLQFKELYPSVGPIDLLGGKEAVFLAGTIPFGHRDNRYNCPLRVIIIETFPLVAPILQITNLPPHMIIRPTPYVGTDGRVTFPYVLSWRGADYTLAMAIGTASSCFTEKCPIYSTLNSTGQQPPPSLPQQPPQPSQSTPYPTNPNQNFMPMPNAFNYQAPRSTYPSYPSTGYPPQQQSTTGYPPQPQGVPGYPPQVPSYPPTYPPQQPTNPASFSTGTPPYPARSEPVSSYPTRTEAPNNYQTITEDHLKASLVTAVEDKIRSRLRDFLSQANAEIDSLQQNQEDLIKGRSKLDNLLERLMREQEEVSRMITAYEEKNKELELSIEKLNSQSDISPDDMVGVTYPLYKQLLNAFAEENAIQDTIYYLGEALRKGVIELDVFLKNVRELSRRQFMLRALMNKCREAAGLPKV